MKSASRLFIVLFGCLSSFTMALDMPTQRVILTVSGDMDNMLQDSQVKFDLPMLEALPQYSVTTNNPWTKGLHTYRGFSAIDLLAALNANGDVLEVTALNKYMTRVPVSDFVEHGAIFATHRDGVPMSIRNLGPIMLIYPFDQNESLKSEIYFGRSIWQINHIKIVPSSE
ncbi:hypothetical protein [Marinomonas sp. THO17]|uniref:hypothetical protein n=1 Tax=Marinomonas sp. THO17 TaxID=3149048 RepID=UPI00336BD49F